MAKFPFHEDVVTGDIAHIAAQMSENYDRCYDAMAEMASLNKISASEMFPVAVKIAVYHVVCMYLSHCALQKYDTDGLGDFVERELAKMNTPETLAMANKLRGMVTPEVETKQ